MKRHGEEKRGWEINSVGAADKWNYGHSTKEWRGRWKGEKTERYSKGQRLFLNDWCLNVLNYFGWKILGASWVIWLEEWLSSDKKIGGEDGQACKEGGSVKCIVIVPSNAAWDDAFNSARGIHHSFFTLLVLYKCILALSFSFFLSHFQN